MNAFITSMGRFLPGEPIANDAMEEYLGKIGGRASRVGPRVLKQNGIRSRHYAIDRQQQTLYSNSEMAAHAVRDAIARSAIEARDIDFLAAATSQGDFPLPGFASTVHAELAIPSCEIATLHGVCASGVMALKSAALHVHAAGRKSAVACASEFASRLFKASRFEAQAGIKQSPLGFDTEFLRWMLSDGAGAALLQASPDSHRLCLAIESIELRSFANRFEPCMYVGPKKNGARLASWLDYPSYQAAADDGAINLRQDVRMLGDVVKCAVEGLLDFVEEKGVQPAHVDWLVVHYSSHIFRDQSHELAAKAGFDIPLGHWFTNLDRVGNVGSASIYLLLEELMCSEQLAPGQTVLCLVPESGRFLFGYMLLRVVEGVRRTPAATRAPLPRTDAPHLDAGPSPLSQSMVRQLARVWFDFEERLHAVPIVAKLNRGQFTIEDYRALLFNLRQQVIDGSRWIARAASSITVEYFPIRSAFIAHTSDEHRDFEMLERNYAAAGGDLEAMRRGTKNIGSEALSAYLLHIASQENPFALIGAMFIIEGLGNRVARHWGERVREVLGLDNDAVSFFLYHAESDVKHFLRLDLTLGSDILTEKRVAEIVKCAEVTARLYCLQLEEIGNT
jgi:3-oxoacyl-[acyl-carrier-protein] synthase-3